MKKQTLPRSTMRQRIGTLSHQSFSTVLAVIRAAWLYARKVPGWMLLSIAILFVFVSFILIYTVRVQADVTTAKHPGTAADNTPISGVGTIAWTNPGNATASDNAYATAGLGASVLSHYLNLTNFGFTTSDIPTGSSIDGINITIERNGTVVASRCHITDNSIKIVKGGSITGSTEMATTTQWATSDEIVTYGSSSNLWGQTWAVSDITASNFGIAISAKNVKDGGSGSTCTASIDDVKVTIYYTPPAAVLKQAAYRVFGNTDASSTVTLSEAWGGSGTDQGNAVVQTSDGGYALAGYSNNFGAGVEDAIIQKYDAAGNLQWNKTWGGTNTDIAFSIIQTFDGGYAITGYTSGFGAGGTDLILAKFDSSGNLSWSKAWGGTSNDEGRSLVQTSDGGYIVTGDTASFGAGGSDLLLAKFDFAGNLSWNKVWGGTQSDQGNSVVQTSDGGYAVAGSTVLAAGGGRAALLKYDSSGNLTWNILWGGTGGTVDTGSGVVQTSDGGYALTGSTPSFGAGGGDVFLAKFNSSGVLSWNKVWGGTGTDSATGIVKTSDGGFAITGYTQSFTAGSNDEILLKYDSSGNLSWNTTLGGSGLDQGNSLVQTSDGGYATLGYTATYGVGGNDFLFAKFDSSGAISGCSTKCTNPTATTSSPSASTSNPTMTTSSPSATSTQPSAASSSPLGTFTSVVAVAPTIDVGSPLAALNTAATVPGDGTPFRVRIDIGVSSNTMLAGSTSSPSLKLQYAPMTTSCDASFTNTPSSAYSDVTSISTVRYYDNVNGGSGMGLTTNANDPTDSTNTLVRQTYQEKGTSTFTNTSAVPTGQDGVWDFALTTLNTLQSTHYCLRVIYSSGTTLNSYTTASSTSAIVEIITASSTYTQSSYRLFQAGQSMTTYVKAWGGTNTENGSAVVRTSDGGCAITGSTISFGAGGGSFDVFLAKFDSSGSLTWSQTWGGAGSDIPYGLMQTSTGDYVVVGGTNTSFTGAGGEDTFIIKYNSSGVLQWSKLWGGSLADEAKSVTETTDGGYVITGQTTSFGAGQNDMFVIKFTAAGAYVWSTLWGGSADDFGYGVVATSDGGVAVTGQTKSFGDLTNGDAFIAKFNSAGTLSWNDTWGGFGTSTSDQGNAIIQTSDGGYVMAGNTNSFGAGGQDAFIAKYDSSGVLSWSRAIGGTGSDTAVSIMQTSAGNYVIGGQTSSFGAGNSDLYLAVYTTAGALQWYKTWGSSSADSVAGMAATNDGGYVMAGTVSSFGAGSNDALLAKFDASGSINGCSSAACNGYAATLTIVNPNYVTTAATTSTPTSTLTTPAPTTTTPAPTVTVGIANGTSAVVGSAITGQNPAGGTAYVGSQFRLRLDVDVSGSGTAISGQSFKLQYSVRGSDLSCDTSFTGESYADVTSTTPVHFYDGASNASGDSLHWSANDPTSGSNALVPQSYQESNNFTNGFSSLYSGTSGEWDFYLSVKSSVQAGTDYCLRVVTSTGSTISYSQIVDIAYAPPMISLMRHGAWFSSSGVKQNYLIKGQ